MSYTINLTDGSIFATVSDGTINTASSVTIIGKNYAGYGEFLGENFLKLLENSANATAPAAPLSGQLWYDSSQSLLKVFNGTTFKNLGAATSQGTAPVSNIVGDMWFDTANVQLNVWDGTAFVLVGPSFTAGTGTSGAIVDSVIDDISGVHVVIKLYTNDEIVAIISKDAQFTPDPAIAGFTAINPGLQLATTVQGIPQQFIGTATNALLIDGTAKADFLSSVGNDSTVGTLGVLNDGGITFGAGSDGKLEVTGGENVVLENITNNADLLFKVNFAGVPTTAITINGVTGKAQVADPATNSEIASKGYVDTAITSGTSGSLLADGSVTIKGIILPDADGTRNLGATATKFNNVYATTFVGESTSAQYADLAERFQADTAMAPGTVVMLGGAEEITKLNEELSDEVFGVISTRAAYLMNAGAGNDETHPPVAMSGRVPVCVIGKLVKGQRLVSAGNGFARGALQSELSSFNVIGRALENKTTEGEGTVEAFVTVN